MTTIPKLTRRAAGITTIGALLAVAAGCASKPAVHHDQEPGTDLKAYKTFAFYAPAGPGYLSLLEQRLRHAAREQLERRNYVYDERRPELRVNYALQVLDKQALQSTPTRLGYRGWAGSGVETVEIRQGTLAIDLVDTRRNALVWRAVAEGRLDEQAMKQPGATLDAAVGELFARLDGARQP